MCVLHHHRNTHNMQSKLKYHLGHNFSRIKILRMTVNVSFGVFYFHEKLLSVRTLVQILKLMFCE